MDIFVMVGIGCAILIMLIGVILLLRRPSTHESLDSHTSPFPKASDVDPALLSGDFSQPSPLHHNATTSFDALNETVRSARTPEAIHTTLNHFEEDAFSSKHQPEYASHFNEFDPIKHELHPKSDPVELEKNFNPDSRLLPDHLAIKPEKEPSENLDIDEDIAKPYIQPSVNTYAPNEGDDLLEAVNRLDTATAEALPPIDTQPIPSWSGSSPLIDHHQKTLEKQDQETSLKKANHVIVMYMLPSNYRALDGDKVLAQLKQYGLRYGEMSLFHRYEEGSGQGPLMFSVLKYTPDGPQGFDLEDVASEQLQGLAFFLAIPHEKALSGFDMMSSIASLLARDFSARLYDEEMNPWSRERKDYYRHKVIHLAQS